MPRKIGVRKGRTKKMSLPKSTIHKEIRLQTIKDLIAQHLYACSIIDDNIEIDRIEFDSPIVPWETVDPVPLIIKTKGANGGTSIKLNGKDW
jgi:hypothetical protein